MGSIFICHSSSDAREAMNLALALEAKGSPCWIAPRDIPAGADYPHEIVMGIQRADAFLILLSPAAVLSKHILRELELAASAGKRILPVRCGRVELNHSMTFLLAGVQWIEVSEDDLRQHSHRMAERILDGRGTRLGSSSSRGRKLPVVVLAVMALAGLLAVGWAKWPNTEKPPSDGGSSVLESNPTPPRPVAEVIEPGHPRLGPVAATIPPLVDESESNFVAAPKAIPIPIPIPEGKWMCIGEAAFEIEWDMTFSGGPEHLTLTGHKSRVNKKKAQIGERNTTLTLQGRIENRKWTGTYSEKNKAGTDTGTFEADFTEDFSGFTAKIFTSDGKASSPLTGKTVP